MKFPSVTASISLLLTAGVGGVVTYVAKTCDVSLSQLAAGAGMAFIAGLIHLYFPQPGSKL
jgi:hypothetical protein